MVVIINLSLSLKNNFLIQNSGIRKMEEIHEFIKVEIPMLKRICKTEYEKVWSCFVIDENTFDDYKGLYVFGDPSSQVEYENSINEATKSFMEHYRVLKRGETIDKSEESVKEFLTTPIGNGNLKDGYILLQHWVVSEEKGIKDFVECYIKIRITSRVPFTYGMILIAYSHGTEACQLGHSYPTGAKIGISDDHFVFELYNN